MYNEINLNKEELTIMGVQFDDILIFESTAAALGSNMYEGFVPTQKMVEIIRDYVLGKISLSELIELINLKSHV